MRAIAIVVVLCCLSQCAFATDKPAVDYLIK